MVALHLTALARAWTRAWRQHGSLTATVVLPLARWTLPTGYAWTPSRDGIYHTVTGAILSNPSSYWATTTVNYIPLRPTELTQNLITSGLLQPGSLDISVYGADADTLETCHRLLIGADTFRVRSLTRSPNTWATLTLEKTLT